MTRLAIRRGLETKLASITPTTQFENTELDNNVREAEQEAYLMFARPENPTMGDTHYRQFGVFQITLRYPLNEGSTAIGEQADILAAEFHRGLSVIADGVTTVIYETPEIGEGRKIEGKWVVVVRVRFHADIFEGV